MKGSCICNCIQKDSPCCLKYLRRKQNTKRVILSMMGKCPSFECACNACATYSLKYLYLLKLHECKYVFDILMQTFDPISLILIMDDSTLLFYFDTSYYQTSIIKLNYWKPNIISKI